jgi:hypothetical protein
LVSGVGGEEGVIDVEGKIGRGVVGVGLGVETRIPM